VPRPRFSRLTLAVAAVLASGAAAADSPPEWSRPRPGFLIVGPVYYVGTEGIASYLVRTRDGLILLDGGLEESVPALERNIVALGFKLSDVKLLIATHAHWDHAAGLARLKHDTRAAFVASAGDRHAYETGIAPSDITYRVTPFAPITVDRVLVDGRPLRLGGIAMTPVLTPGHTAGCTSWTLRIVERGRPLTVLFPCSITVAGNKLVGNRGYPGIAGDYRRTFARLRRLHADVVLPAHPEIADVIARARRRDAGDRAAFIDPTLLPRLVNDAEAAFDQALKAETRQ
jgi:metallo-beta-lactamase class B